MTRAVAWVLGLLAILAGGPVAACSVLLQASVPVARAGGLFLVPVTIDGVTLDFILDTGAERSVVGLQAADRLGLARDEWVSTDSLGAGGRDQRRLGRPRTLSLGGMALRRHTVAADHSVVVGPIPESVGGRAVAGLLGQDFLSVFDLDLDPAAGVLRLYQVAGCSGSFVPLAAAAVPATRPVRNVLVLPVRVAGQALAAELDSGASVSVLMAPGMVRLGLAPGGEEVLRGFGSNAASGRRQAFGVQVGRLPPGELALLVSPIRQLRSIDMLLGADWIATHRIWISWATNQVFIAG